MVWETSRILLNISLIGCSSLNVPLVSLTVFTIFV